MSLVQAVTPLVAPTRLVTPPAITEADARQQVRNARRCLTRAQNKLDGPGSARCERRLTAAENRLDAVLSQQPDRTIGGWAA